MTYLNIESAKTTKGTAKRINTFLWESRGLISLELASFYRMVHDMINDQLRKPAKHRATVKELCERAYNIDAYILASGAASVEHEIISL